MMMPRPYTPIAAATAAMPGSLKKTPPQMVAAITPVTRKSYCSITEPIILANATLKICQLDGLATALLILFSSPFKIITNPCSDCLLHKIYHEGHIQDRCPAESGR